VNFALIGQNPIQSQS